jgi:hypothetical protein
MASETDTKLFVIVTYATRSTRDTYYSELGIQGELTPRLFTNQDEWNEPAIGNWDDLFDVDAID